MYLGQAVVAVVRSLQVHVVEDTFVIHGLEDEEYEKNG